MNEGRCWYRMSVGIWRSVDNGDQMDFLFYYKFDC